MKAFGCYLISIAAFLSSIARADDAVFAGGCFWCVEALYQETGGPTGRIFNASPTDPDLGGVTRTGHPMDRRSCSCFMTSIKPLLGKMKAGTGMSTVFTLWMPTGPMCSDSRLIGETKDIPTGESYRRKTSSCPLVMARLGTQRPHSSASTSSSTGLRS